MKVKYKENGYKFIISIDYDRIIVIIIIIIIIMIIIITIIYSFIVRFLTC